MNTDNLIRELHREHLCTYFILPLLKLSKFRFIADSNFVNSYLSNDHKYIIVQVLETLFLEYKLSQHPRFEGIYKDMMGRTFIVYKIPKKFSEDVTLFVQGKYSNMSQIAKEYIIKYSGLRYQFMTETQELVTDVRLLALTRSKTAKKMWEDILDCQLEDDQELLSLSKEDSFMDLGTLQRIETDLFV